MTALRENEEAMKAWRLERLGGALTFEDVPVPEPRPHSVLVRIEAVPLSRTSNDTSKENSPSTAHRPANSRPAPMAWE